jgi:predicted ester cyclase
MDTRELIYTFFEEVINKGRLELLDDLMVEDFVNTRTAFDSAARLAAEHSPVALRREGSSGRDGFRAGIVFIRTVFEDYHNDLDELVVDGDRAAGSWTARGLHVGSFLGIPATGQRLEMAEAGVMTVRDGKLASFWGIGDELGVLNRFGAVTFHPEGGQ